MFAKLKERLRRPCFSRFRPRIGKRIAVFSTINLTLYSLHSKAQRWEGYNVLAWVMDEADAFQTETGHQNAEEVHNVLQSSAISRFPDTRWIGLIISYPRSEIGFLLTYADTAEKDGFAYVDRAATWEVHPHYDPRHPFYRAFATVRVHDTYEVPKPYEGAFKYNPVLAAMTYLCKPPPVEGAFFEYPDLLERCSKVEVQPALWANISVTTHEVEVGVGEEQTTETRRFPSLYIARRIKPAEAHYYIHGDPGEVKDGFALCLAHMLPEQQYIETLRRALTLNKVQVDLLLEWKPEHNMPVDYTNVKDVIIQLCNWFPILQVSFDTFQSAQIIQELIEAGINAKQLAFSASQQLAMYEALKIVVYNDLIEWPRLQWNMLRPQLRRDFSASRSPTSHEPGRSRAEEDRPRPHAAGSAHASYRSHLMHHYCASTHRWSCPALPNGGSERFPESGAPSRPAPCARPRQQRQQRPRQEERAGLYPLTLRTLITRAGGRNHPGMPAARPCQGRHSPRAGGSAAQSARGRPIGRPGALRLTGHARSVLSGCVALSLGVPPDRGAAGAPTVGVPQQPRSRPVPPVSVLLSHADVRAVPDAGHLLLHVPITQVFTALMDHQSAAEGVAG